MSKTKPNSTTKKKSAASPARTRKPRARTLTFELVRDLPAVSDPEARIINQVHKYCVEATAASVGWALINGHFLRIKKTKLPHGQWLPWLKEHCQFHEQTARRYMALTDRLIPLRSRKSNTVLDLITKEAENFGEALALQVIEHIPILNDEDGVTLTELYQDFGIIKRPRKGPGDNRNNGGNSTKKKPLTPHEEAQLMLFEPLRSLRSTRGDESGRFAAWLQSLPDEFDPRSAADNGDEGEEPVTIAVLEEEIRAWHHALAAEKKRRKSEQNS